MEMGGKFLTGSLGDSIEVMWHSMDYFLKTIGKNGLESENVELITQYILEYNFKV